MGSLSFKTRLFGAGASLLWLGLICAPASAADPALIAAAKAEPGKINYASAGNGAPNHLASEMLKNMAGINLRHVPYKGAPQSIVDVLGGHVPVIFGSIPQLSPHVKAARLRALGVSHTKRIAQLPDVPTISEAGVPGYEITPWGGYAVPAGTPRAVVDKLNTELNRIVAHCLAKNPGERSRRSEQ